jgi:hypothetical protein
VLRARVVEYQWSPRDSGHQAPPVSMMIEILEVYKGAPASHTIIVQGDRGVQCRPYVSRFPIGTEWVFALWTNPTGSREMSLRKLGELLKGIR